MRSLPPLSKRSSSLPTPLALELRPSRWLAVLQIAAALLAVVAIVRSGLSLLPQLLALGVLLLIVCSSLRRQGWFGGRSRCRGLRWENGRWLWIGADGRSLALQLRRAVVWRQLVVMHFVGPGGRRSLCLLPDNLEADALRRLRLCLRYLPVYEAMADEELMLP